MRSIAIGGWPVALMRTPILFLACVAFVLFTVTIPGFASVTNVGGILLAALPLLLLGTGQTFVLVSGGIDLSAPSVVGLASVAGGLIMSADAGLLAARPTATVWGLAAMIATGALVGLVNGICAGALRMPPFMVTLTVGMFAGGLAILLVRLAANTETMFGLPGSFVLIGGTPVVAGLFAFGSALGAHGALEHTRFGAMLRATGYNSRAARMSGVPLAYVTAVAYTVSGMFSALAAVLLTGSLETAAPTHGRTLLLDVIGATVIGGTSLSGGRGHVWGTALGVLFLATIGNALTLLNVSDFLITILKGLLILIAAIWDRATARQ
jgi:ribose transport system permease protein